MQHVGDGLREGLVVRLHGDRGRQPGRDFLGERRAGDDGQRHVLADQRAGHFMQEAARAGFEALGRPRHADARRAQRRQQFQRFGEGVRRHHDQDQADAVERGGQIGGRAQRVGQRNPRQVARVLVALVDRLDLFRVAAPQRGGVPVACDQRSERGPPGARAQHRDRGLAVGHAQALPIWSVVGCSLPCAPRWRRPSA